VRHEEFKTHHPLHIMKINEFKIISLQPWWVKFYSNNPETDNLLILYRDHPELKKKIIDFLTCFVKTNEFKYIFNAYCSRCGNCCKRDNIIVQGGEIFFIALQLCMTEKEFYSKYLYPTSSWSDYDGIIRLVNGKCPFLEIKSSGRYNCTIYNNRPASCRFFYPASDLCKKEDSDLIEQIKSIDIKDGKLTVTLISGCPYNILLNEELIKKMTHILSYLEGIETKKTHQVNELIRHMVEPEQEEDKSGQDFSEENVLEKELHKKNHLFAIKNFFLKEILFTPMTMILTYDIDEREYNFFINYAQDDLILEQMRTFTETLIGFIKEYNINIFKQSWTVCHMCGNCCGENIIEIEPSDIRRLAEHFKITVKKFKKKYMEPGRYGWNPEGGCIKKFLDKKTGRNICAFLEKKETDLSYCKVHQVKPELCSNYTPGIYKCLKNKSNDYNFRLISNIQNIYLNTEILKVNIISNYVINNEDLYIEWRKYNNIRDNIQSILESLKNYLHKKYFSL